MQWDDIVIQTTLSYCSGETYNTIGKCGHRMTGKYHQNSERSVAMTTLTIELPPDLYERLRKEAQQAGRPVEALIEEWLARHFPPPAPGGERERAREVLRAAGLLTELGPELKQ